MAILRPSRKSTPSNTSAIPPRPMISPTWYLPANTRSCSDNLSYPVLTFQYYPAHQLPLPLSPVGVGVGMGDTVKLGSGIGAVDSPSVGSDPGVDSVGPGTTVCWM